MCVCVYLDLVCVHASVGHQDVDVLQPLGLVHTNLLVQQKTCTTTTAETANRRINKTPEEGGAN